MKLCVISTGIFKIEDSQDSSSNCGGITGYGGLEQIAYLHARGLARKGYQVSLVAPEGSHVQNVEIIPVGPPGQWNEHQSFNSYWQRLSEFDCVIDHSWNKHFYLLKGENNGINNKFSKIPCLGWLHAPINTMYGSLPPNVEKSCFVTISKDQASHFEALFEKSARVCYNGVDMDFYKPLPVQRSDRALFLARFSSIKGPDLAETVCREAEMGLDLVGDTQLTQEPEYFQHCKRLADGKLIKIIGGVSRGNSVWWMGRANVFLHPNQRFREPFGLAPVEAQACGCPVIGWRRGSLPEIVKHGETGWLVSSEKELLEVVKMVKRDGIDPKMRIRCREWASQFSVSNMILRVEELCEEAVASGGW